MCRLPVDCANRATAVALRWPTLWRVLRYTPPNRGTCSFEDVVAEVSDAVGLDYADAFEVELVILQAGEQADAAAWVARRNHSAYGRPSSQ
jgi:hypothetical protein